MNKKRGCGTIIIDSNGRILMAQRVKKGDGFKWCIPGGKIEEGEDPVEGAIREIKEESGLVVKKKDMELVTIIEEDNIDDYTFVTRVHSGEVKDNEQEMINFKWFSTHDMYNINKETEMFEATWKSLLAYVDKQIKN